jgi:hypothetical protein
VILVLTQSGDPAATIVIDKLRRRGGDVTVFDPARFPVSARFTVSITPSNGLAYGISFDNVTIDLASVDAVWVRRPGDPVADERIIDQDARRFVQNESKRFLDDIWNSINCLWVPARLTEISRADLRLSQLRVAQAIGLETPQTLATNDPDALLDFYQMHDGDVVSKLVEQELDYTRFMRYTDMVSASDLVSAVTLRHAPALLQRYVPKRVEIRVTVVGDRTYAAEIDSQGSHRARHDWRRYDYDRTPYSQHHLPQEIGAACVQLTEQLGLTFGAIDMILTPDGRYVFLELNPTGQWDWIEGLTGLPISDGLCELLMSRSQTRLVGPK